MLTVWWLIGYHFNRFAAIETKLKLSNLERRGYCTFNVGQQAYLCLVDKNAKMIRPEGLWARLT
jgi:hypothetical protein